MNFDNSGICLDLAQTGTWPAMCLWRIPLWFDFRDRVSAWAVCVTACRRAWATTAAWLSVARVLLDCWIYQATAHISIFATDQKRCIGRAQTRQFLRRVWITLNFIRTQNEVSVISESIIVRHRVATASQRCVGLNWFDFTGVCVLGAPATTCRVFVSSFGHP